MAGQEMKLHREELSSQKNAHPMTETEIQDMKKRVFAWDVFEGEENMPHLTRSFKFNDFANALLFTNKIGELAESESHHPRILLTWGKVKVEWWSHMLGGLHRNDFIMAARVNDIYERWTEITGTKDMLQKELEDSFPADRKSVV